METVEFEDGSGIIHDDECVYAVRDDGVWENPVVGKTYYDAEGSAIVGCYLMPDTSMEAPTTDMTGALFVAILIGVAIFNRVRHARR